MSDSTTTIEVKNQETNQNQNHQHTDHDQSILPQSNCDPNKQVESSIPSKRLKSVESDLSIEYEKTEPNEFQISGPSSSLSPAPVDQTQGSSKYSVKDDQTPHSSKRRRTASPSNPTSPKLNQRRNQSPIILTSPLSSHPNSPSHLNSNSDPNLNFEVGKVVWADIGCTPNETYWWPGIIEKSKSFRENNNQFETQNHQMMIRLFEEKGKNSKALSKDRVRSISSFNKVKAFVVDLNFQPREFNPILKVKGSSRDYPTERSLSNSYATAYECHSVYAYEDEDDLPDVGTCMIPLSQQTRSAVSKSQSTQETKERSVDSTVCDDNKTIEIDDEDDGPDPEININDEVVLSKDKRKGQYWPARITGYVGVKILKQPGNRSKNMKARKEKYYHIKFCDGTQIEVPRSFFLTSDQAEFHQVSIGQVTTDEIKFNKFIEVLKPHLSEIDLIVKGKSTDLSIQSQHQTFLLNVKGRALIPRDVKYGRYTEKLIVEVGHFLRDRYLNATESNEYDPGFIDLDDSQKSQYVFDILVPQLFWLVTVKQHKEALLEESPILKESTNTKESEERILKKAKELALAELHDADIVDRVYALRKTNSDDQAENGKRSIGRSTCNSQRTFVKDWYGSDSG
ncbi:hypothetical protein DFH28DRAFT_1120643 [Melampsora americana]|nr:hypothetical protein DFH28DRAFT_1120643 [Melampsora americana]